MKRRLAIALLLALAGWGATGVYLVQPDEIVVVRRCGELLKTPRLPGAHFELPWGIDRRERVKPREVKRVSLGLVSLAGEASGVAASHFLSADRNLVSVRATVQYTVSDPVAYLRQVAVVEVMVGRAGEACLLRVLAAHPVDWLLTRGKTEIATQLRSQLQQTVDKYALGISVRSVDLGSLEPPAEVAAAFADVVAAQRDREQAINQAHSYAGQTIAEAHAVAQQIRHAARADGDRRIRAARGEADRFERLRIEYERSPELTARRMYWESLAAVLPRLRAKLLLDGGETIDVTVVGSGGDPAQEVSRP